tara:strand:- start:200 stop:340 length:141 start_codon:yes stop_codon:yes gene_type:complete
VPHPNNEAALLYILILDEDSSGLLIQIQLHEQTGGDPSGGIREAGS